MSHFARPDLCEPCGGKCCKHFPGALYPSDFIGARGRVDLNILRALLEEGLVKLDNWIGTPDAPWLPGEEDVEFQFPRPAAGSDPIGQVCHGLWGGEPGGTCVMLKSYGCSLPPEHRPLGCRKLEPAEKCREHTGLPFPTMNDKEAAAIAWYPWARELEQLADEVQEVLDGSD